MDDGSFWSKVRGFASFVAVMAIVWLVIGAFGASQREDADAPEIDTGNVDEWDEFLDDVEASAEASSGSGAPGRLAPYPRWEGYDLDCPDIGEAVAVNGPDPHRLDADGDGIGCDIYL